MLGASLSEVWGENFNTKKEKKKKLKRPMSHNEMEKELLADVDEDEFLHKKEYEKKRLLRDDRLLKSPYKTVQYADVRENKPKIIEDDPDYLEFLEFKKNKNKPIQEDNKIIQPKDQQNELLLYIFTGFFLILLYDNIYKLGKKSY
jgi:hypothetical protein